MEKLGGLGEILSKISIGHGVPLDQSIQLLEETLIMKALIQAQGNKETASRLLSMNRTTLLSKSKKYGLDLRPEYRRSYYVPKKEEE